MVEVVIALVCGFAGLGIGLIWSAKEHSVLLDENIRLWLENDILRRKLTIMESEWQ